jgi:hypothetical protein
MKSKTFVGLGLGISVLVLGTFTALAKSSYLDDFNDVYGTQNSRLDTCDTCHPDGRTSRLNGYADDMVVKHKQGLSWREAILAIEGLDSDGDGWKNLVEIEALTSPGDAADHPSETTPTPTPTTPPTPTATLPSPSPTATLPSPTPTDPAPAETFVDVSVNYWAYPYIEALYKAGYVAGCSSDPLMYCPETAMTRAESAVFVERGIWGAGYLPVQPSRQTFADVLLSEWYAKWADGLWNDGFTSGCGSTPLVYCPLMQHSIAEGAVFYLRMMRGASYLPPDPVGLFEDVPTNAWYAKWIEEAYQAGLIIPCETSPAMRACPADPLTRAYGAYMMVQAKGMPTE